MQTRLLHVLPGVRLARYARKPEVNASGSRPVALLLTLLEGNGKEEVDLI